MADPAVIITAAEVILKATKDEEGRKRLLMIILGPTIFLLVLIVFISS